MRKQNRVIQIADLFCGAGGTSTGAIEAIEMLGNTAQLTAINHWDVAIATHTANHPSSRHLCTSVDDIDPQKLFKEGELDILWASPSCTHHSVARGGKPVNDQSRATAWCVVRWAESLRPNVILVENVPEFRSWGPIGVDGQPLASRKGELFNAWRAAVEACGYQSDCRVFCAADYGDPTTRQRLFVQFVRGRRKIMWPDPTHSNSKEGDLFGKKAPWRTARDHVIDWSLPGKSIYERERPLSDKTMRRIMAGLEKFGLKPFVVPQQSNPTPKGVDEPLGAVVAEGSGPKLCEPMIITMEHGGGVRSAAKPLPTVTTAKGGAMAVAQPFLIPQQSGEDRVRSVDKPLQTVTTESRGIALAQPFLIAQFGEREGQTPRTHDIADPLPTVTAQKGGPALIEPYLVKVAGTEDRRPRSVDEPHPTVTAGGVQLGVAQPFLVKFRGTNDAADVNQPAPTVTASGMHLGLAEPFLVHTAHAGDRAPLDIKNPLPAVAGNRGDVAVIEPFVISAGGPSCPARGVSQPLGTVLTRDHRALVQPSLLPQQSDGALRPVSQPAPTVATSGAIALVEPFLIEYYGNGTPNAIDDPLPTVTCNDRHALVRPIVVINGERYQLDIRFRMLQPHELAKAQGFRHDYKFTGTKTEQVKQIGNAVPRNLARALVLAVLSQTNDISAYLPEEESATTAA